MVSECRLPVPQLAAQAAWDARASGLRLLLPGVLQAHLSRLDSSGSSCMVRPSARAKLTEFAASGHLGGDLHRRRLVHGAWAHQAARQRAEVYDVLRAVVS